MQPAVQVVQVVHPVHPVHPVQPVQPIQPVQPVQPIVTFNRSNISPEPFKIISILSLANFIYFFMKSYLIQKASKTLKKSNDNVWVKDQNDLNGRHEKN